MELTLEASQIDYPNKCIVKIIYVFFGVIIFLLGMFIVSSFFHGVLCSIVGVICIDVSVFFIMKATKIKQLLGKNSVRNTLIIISFIIILNIIFSTEYVFKNYLDGYAISISNHYEHDWTFTQIKTLAERIRSGMKIGTLSSGMALNQYNYLYIYSSLLFVFGGVSVTHICLWNGLHLVIIAVFVTFTSYKYGIKEQKKLKTIFYIAMFQPAFMSLFVYDRDIVGESVVIMALYIFVSVYNKPILCILTFPIYGFLFYTLRYQYLLVAFILCIWAMFKSRRVKSSTFIALLVLVITGKLFFDRFDITNFVWSVLNLDDYILGTSFHISSIISNIIRSMFGYFPWTNLFRDIYWWYHIFLCLQATMTLSLWIWLLYNSIYRKKIRETFKNPMIIFASASWLFALVSSGHVKYFAVCAPLLATGFVNYDNRKFKRLLYITISIVFIGSILYNSLGLTGSGVLNTSGRS